MFGGVHQRGPTVIGLQQKRLTVLHGTDCVSDNKGRHYAGADAKQSRLRAKLN